MTVPQIFPAHFPKRIWKQVKDVLVAGFGVFTFSYATFHTFIKAEYLSWIMPGLIPFFLYAFAQYIRALQPKFSGLHIYSEGFEVSMPYGISSGWGEVEELWLVRSREKGSREVTIRVLPTGWKDASWLARKMPGPIKARDIDITDFRGEPQDILAVMATGLLRFRAEKALKTAAVPQLRVALSNAIRFLELHDPQHTDPLSTGLVEKLEAYVALSDIALQAQAAEAAVPFFPTGEWDELTMDFPEGLGDQCDQVGDEIMALVGYQDTGRV